MIILRQKQFAFGGFDWAFDSNGKLRTDLTDEDKAKLEAYKKNTLTSGKSSYLMEIKIKSKDQTIIQAPQIVEVALIGMIS